MDSVSCDLQTGSGFPQLASTCSDWKIGGKSGQKSRSVFQALVAQELNHLGPYRQVIIFCN